MLHEKYHSSNHHTASTLAVENADTGLDAFASHEQPFQGDFVLNGTFTSVYKDVTACAAHINTSSAVLVSGTNIGIEGYGKVVVNGDIQVHHLILTNTTLNLPLSNVRLTDKVLFSNDTNRRFCFRLWELSGVNLN